MADQFLLNTLGNLETALNNINDSLSRIEKALSDKAEEEEREIVRSELDKFFEVDGKTLKEQLDELTLTRKGLS